MLELAQKLEQLIAEYGYYAVQEAILEKFEELRHEDLVKSYYSERELFI